MQSAFFSLIKHEVKWRRIRQRENQQESGRWWILYPILGFLFGIGYLTYIAVQGDFFKPEFLWTFTLGFPFIAFGMGYSLVNREWEGGTSGWWLTLPYSRTQLISAKLWASLLQTWMIYLLAFVVCLLLGCYVMLLQGILSFSDLLGFMFLGFVWFLLMVGISPFTTAFGVLNAVLVKSRIKALLVLLWGLFWIAPNIFFWTLSADHRDGGMFSQMFSPDLAWDFLSPYFLSAIVVISVSWLLAYLMVRSAARVIDRKLLL